MKWPTFHGIRKLIAVFIKILPVDSVLSKMNPIHIITLVIVTSFAFKNNYTVLVLTWLPSDGGYRIQQSNLGVSCLTREDRNIQFPKRRIFKCWTTGKFQKLSNPNCYTHSSETCRLQQSQLLSKMFSSFSLYHTPL
jgi:hypothetical protein